MSDDYMPGVKDLREHYSDWWNYGIDEPNSDEYVLARLAKFDRFLAEHDAAKGGVWVHVTGDHYETIGSVYPAEIDALRAAAEDGYGRAVFVPWGTSLDELRVVRPDKRGSAQLDGHVEGDDRNGATGERERSRR